MPGVEGEAGALPPGPPLPLLLWPFLWRRGRGDVRDLAIPPALVSCQVQFHRGKCTLTSWQSAYVYINVLVWTFTYR